MANFLVRIELHNASAENYTSLHSLMKTAGFSRTITSDAGNKYRLPTAEYEAVGDYTLKEVINAAKRAATQIEEDCSILAVEYTAAKWINLRAVL